MEGGVNVLKVCVTVTPQLFGDGLWKINGFRRIFFSSAIKYVLIVTTDVFSSPSL